MTFTSTNIFALQLISLTKVFTVIMGSIILFHGFFSHYKKYEKLKIFKKIRHGKT